MLAYGSGLHTFILKGESILVFARLLQDATSDWNSETGSTFANTLPADKNSKLETWSATLSVRRTGGLGPSPLRHFLTLRVICAGLSRLVG